MQNTINLASESASDVSTKKHSKNSKSKDVSKAGQSISTFIAKPLVKTHKRNKTSKIPEAGAESQIMYKISKGKVQEDLDENNDSIQEDIMEESPVRELQQTPVQQTKDKIKDGQEEKREELEEKEKEGGSDKEKEMDRKEEDGEIKEEGSDGGEEEGRESEERRETGKR